VLALFYLPQLLYFRLHSFLVYFSCFHSSPEMIAATPRPVLLLLLMLLLQ
jgi:hypothetical protein